jgi:hypothetical protein
MDSGSRGDGDHSYYGGGVLLRRDNTNGFYYEGSLHGGYVKGSYSGMVNGSRGAYSSGSAYLAMHGGLGKIYTLPHDSNLDVYGKLFWTHTAGDSVTLHTVNGDASYNFDALNSVASRLGVRYGYGIAPHQKLYVGAGWEYEWNAAGGATYEAARPLRTESPSRKGSSGLLELGWSKEATRKEPYDLTVRVTGWAGRQKGFTFNTRLNFHI